MAVCSLAVLRNDFPFSIPFSNRQKEKEKRIGMALFLSEVMPPFISFSTAKSRPDDGLWKNDGSYLSMLPPIRSTHTESSYGWHVQDWVGGVRRHSHRLLDKALAYGEGHLFFLLLFRERLVSCGVSAYLGRALINSSFLAYCVWALRGTMVLRGFYFEGERFSFASATCFILMVSGYFGWIRVYIDTSGGRLDVELRVMGWDGIELRFCTLRG
jgi:hypothetical protein